jgi:hypothetical protein
VPQVEVAPGAPDGAARLKERGQSVRRRGAEKDGAPVLATRRARPGEQRLAMAVPGVYALVFREEQASRRASRKQLITIIYELLRLVRLACSQHRSARYE